LRIAINGFGRIGRCLVRLLADAEDLELVAINDPGDHDQLVHLLAYDSAHGPIEGVERRPDGFSLGQQSPQLLAEFDPAKLPWAALGIDLVIEASGRFTARDKAAAHLEAGAARVVVSAPSSGADKTIVYGVNQHGIESDDQVISAASCTTNCLAPVMAVLDRTFGVVGGAMTTVHSVTNDQRLLDLPHPKDLRRARAAISNIIPTSTGAASALKLVFPKATWSLDGMAVRVPVIDVSLVNLVVRFERPASAEAINDALREAAAEGALRGVLAVSDDPCVSSDYLNNPHSSIVDSGLTSVGADGTVRICSWYDNEWGFSSRVLDLVRYLDGVSE
jgi:glyceraldehyde 3-phosphate dehydrogenase